MVFPLFVSIFAGLTVAIITIVTVVVFNSNLKNPVHENVYSKDPTRDIPKRKSDDDSSKNRSFPCQICWKLVDSKDGWSLACSHRFHEICLQNNLYVQIENRCPACSESIIHKTYDLKTDIVD